MLLLGKYFAAAACKIINPLNVLITGPTMNISDTAEVPPPQDARDNNQTWSAEIIGIKDRREECGAGILTR